MRYIALLIIFIFSLAGCKKDPEYTKQKFDVIDKTRTYRNAFLPEELRKTILGDKVVHGELKKGEEAPEKKSEEKSEEKSEDPSKAEHSEKKEKEEVAPEDAKLLPSIEFDRIPLKVYLYEKTDGVLQSRNYTLDYNAGGGDLDLSEFVSTNKRGTFYLAIRADYEGDAEFEVYYLSNAKTRKVGDDVVGSGCGTYYKITSSYEDAMNSKGYAVNTTDRRHVSALAGTYFLVYKRPSGRVALSYLEITDSKHKDLLCRNL